MPLCEAPSIGSALPPLPSLNGTRYRSNLNGSRRSTNSGTSFSFSSTPRGSAAEALWYAFDRAKTTYWPSGLQVGLLCTYAGSSAPGNGLNSPVSRSWKTRMPLTGKNSCENWMSGVATNTARSFTVLIT